VEQLLQSYPQWVQRDPVGAPMLRDELTVLLPGEVEPPVELQSQGFDLIRQSQVLGQRLLVLRTPSGLSLSQALEALRRLLPGADVDFNHLLLGTGRAVAAPPESGASNRAAAPESAAPLLIGLVDEAPRAVPELQGVRLEGKHCERPALQNTGHGTAVAAVLARSARAAGRPLVLHVADFGCGLGAVDTLAAALQNFAAARIPVVNVSAAGPYNRVMARLVELFIARGHVLVAASGNEGPAAPPLYPAALPGVVAVTGVDERGRVLVEASRGPHIVFAAPGIVSVDGGDGLTKVWRGTSFAAPVVSGLLAARLPQPDREAAQAAITSLVHQAVDAGAPGRDPVYGYGLLGLGGAAPATASN
jgi:subtilisin family serine protease